GGRHTVLIAGSKGTYQVACDSAQWDVRAHQSDNGLLLRTNEGAYTARIEPYGNRILVRIGSAGGTFRLLSSREAVQALSPGKISVRDLVAPIPGLVVEVLVRAGEKVEAGQSLVILEAMKMVHSLSATGAGIVSAVACRVGEAVEMGRPLVLFSV